MKLEDCTEVVEGAGVLNVPLNTRSTRMSSLDPASRCRLYLQLAFLYLSPCNPYEADSCNSSRIATCEGGGHSGDLLC